MGIQQALIGAGLASPVVIPGGTLTPYAPGGAAIICFYTDGRLAISDDPAEPSLNWYRPTTTGIGSYYWLRRTVTGDALGSDWGPGWLEMGYGVGMQFESKKTPCSSSVLFEIADDAGGSNIVASGTYVFTVT